MITRMDYNKIFKYYIDKYNLNNHKDVHTINYEFLCLTLFKDISVCLYIDIIEIFYVRIQHRGEGDTYFLEWPHDKSRYLSIIRDHKITYRNKNLPLVNVPFQEADHEDILIHTLIETILENNKDYITIRYGIK